MAKTGKVATIDPHATAKCEAWRAAAGVSSRLLSGFSLIAVLASVALPVTIDTDSMMPAVNSALADNGSGNGNGDGQGRGKGNGKGRGDEMRGGNGNGDDDDDHDDDGGGHNDSPGDDDAPGAGDRIDEPGGGTAGDLDDAGAADLADEMTGVPNGAPTAPTPTALPTIREIFSLGDESVLSAEQELLAIKNGWNLQN